MNYKINYADAARLDGFESVGNAAVHLQAVCHGLALNAGWWTNLETGETFRRPVP